MRVSSLITIASTVLASAVSAVPARRDAETSIICNLAWSNSGQAMNTSCVGADVIFADPMTADERVNSSLKTHTYGGRAVDVMAYLSVGTVNPLYAPDSRLVELGWKQNLDQNSEGELWGDYVFNPDELVTKVLPVMKDIISSYKALGYTMISSDNAKPSTAVTENDAQAAQYAANDRIDPRYVEYMQQIVDYAHSIGVKVTLKNPSYYVNEPTVIDDFDAYIIESMFNYYPWDVDTNEPILYSTKPVWLFQYPGINGLTEEMLKEYMVERDIHLVYLDSTTGYHQFTA
ncbi:hypothetical protein SARC_08016 [Sphaeroforma arctica JP610]|uniref:Glycoside-hydrolase family GH114 TIM-barrel domain-containing protein n=1 Tax=Sphaeroforma arctica JP610 TaxID=667725 RepID=A0A0L0FS36_9EUKA|nr:hypothetical protein SARC_08016 [Sphaeroforma arctica JP610]KNC79597.1 hypothetical protein SARC_08016 [Sphaeroforma arctica JP610]|eukprot:XP_014153499.1 hypothetical protein SARC_08016 [Sphaeroforma arctica JP610]